VRREEQNKERGQKGAPEGHTRKRIDTQGSLSVYQKVQFEYTLLPASDTPFMLGVISNYGTGAVDRWPSVSEW
jgi:hypothetical protein